MIKMKSLVSGGLLLAVAGTALAAPSMQLMPAGAKAGQTAAVVVKGFLGGATSLVGAEVHMKFDAGATVANLSATAVAAPGWVTGAFNVVGGNEAIWIGANGDGQTADGPILTISVGVVGTTKLTMTIDSNVADQDYATYNPAADQKAALINGAVRDLGGPIVGAPSTGLGKVIAVAVGTSLRLLDADTLADKVGFASPVIGPVSGRPAFGMIGAQAVIAVGDDAGKLTVVDAATGASAATLLPLGAKVSTPAIAGDVIYAAVTNASGPATLVKVVAGVASPVATLAGNTVTGAPAVFGGKVAVGTEAGVQVFLTSDGTPSAGVLVAGATIAPIVGPLGAALSANPTTILRFSAVTGSETSSVAQSAGALSEAWYDSTTDKVSFGTASGGLLTVGLSSGAPVLGAVLTPAAIGAQPITLGGTTYVIDAAGNLAADNIALSAPLGGPGAKALAATGRTPGTDSIIAATSAGIVASIAL